MRKRTIRPIGIALLALLALVAALVGAPTAGAATSAPTCTTTTSTGSNTPTPKAYEIVFQYADARSFCEYTSQYAWMTDMRNGTLRGVTQESGYRSITVSDYAAGGVSVTGYFCTKPHARCGVTTYVPVTGKEYPQWHVVEYDPCSLFPPEAKRNFYSSESYALRNLMEDTGKVHFKNLAYFTITSANGNAVSSGTKCAV